MVYRELTPSRLEGPGPSDEQPAVLAMEALSAEDAALELQPLTTDDAKLAADGFLVGYPQIGQRLRAERAEAPAPYGYWGVGGAIFPCSLSSPYILTQNPPGTQNAGEWYYLRYDASAMWAGPWNNPDHYYNAGQGGAMHTTQKSIQTTATSGLGWIIPLKSQGGANPDIVYAAPYRNVPYSNSPSKTLCDAYADEGGAEPCPSSVPIETYSSRVKTKPEWQGGWPYVNQNHKQPQCNVPAPTKTPVLPPATPTPVGGAGHPLDDWVYDFVARGYSKGCGGTSFCPDRATKVSEMDVWYGKAATPNPSGQIAPLAYDHYMTRAEAAKEIIRAVAGANYVPPKCTPPGGFTDVPCK
jgi:hypothetical protein